MPVVDNGEEKRTMRLGQKASIVNGYSETGRVRQAQQLGTGEYVKKPDTIEKEGWVVKTEPGKS